MKLGIRCDLQRVINGDSPATDRPAELADRRDTEEKFGRQYEWEIGDCALLVAPPFDGSNRQLLQDNLIHGFRVIVTARDVDSVAYDTVMWLSVKLARGWR